MDEKEKIEKKKVKKIVKLLLDSLDLGLLDSLEDFNKKESVEIHDSLNIELQKGIEVYIEKKNDKNHKYSELELLEGFEGTDNFKKKIIEERNKYLKTATLELGETIKKKVFGELEKDKKDGFVFRNEFIIMALGMNLKDYFFFQETSKDLSEKAKMQKEIDFAFKLIYEELQKPFLTTLGDKKSVKKIDNEHRKMLLDGMDRALGQERTKIFFERYPKMLKYASKRKKLPSNN